MCFQLAHLPKLLSSTQLKWITKKLKRLFTSLILQKLSHTLSDSCDTTWEGYPNHIKWLATIIAWGCPFFVPHNDQTEASEILLNHAQKLFLTYSFSASIHIWWGHQISYVLCEIRNNVNKKKGSCTMHIFLSKINIKLIQFEFNLAFVSYYIFQWIPSSRRHKPPLIFQRR